MSFISSLVTEWSSFFYKFIYREFVRPLFRWSYRFNYADNRCLQGLHENNVIIHFLQYNRQYDPNDEKESGIVNHHLSILEINDRIISSYINNFKFLKKHRYHKHKNILNEIFIVKNTWYRNNPSKYKNFICHYCQSLVSVIHEERRTSVLIYYRRRSSSISLWLLCWGYFKRTKPQEYIGKYTLLLYFF